jgi:D-alanyl-D-alanine-carboxypeptidase/D-alanyl-D-alanine-endopeptidase
MSYRYKIIPTMVITLWLIVGCSSAKPVRTQATAENPFTTMIQTPTSLPTEGLSSFPTRIAYLYCSGLIPESTELLIQRDVDQGLNVGIVVGIVTPCGREIYSYGYTNLSASQPIDENTVFEIGSIGKTFTTLLLADMVERHELSLDDPIEKFLPENVIAPTYDGRSIQLIDLATHTSGLPSLPDNFAPAYEYNPYADYTLEQMYTALSQTTLTRHIGVAYEYSNFGMGLLGQILSQHSGMNYEELVESRITNVLGMPDTRIRLTPEMQSHLAIGYRDGKQMPLWDIPTLAGAGALRSTVSDLLTYLEANMGLIDSPLYGAMQTTHEPHFPVSASMSVGLGWHIRTEGDLQIIEHHGATGGYWGYAGFIQDKQIGVVILTNTYKDIDFMALALLRSAAAQTYSPSSTTSP